MKRIVLVCLAVVVGLVGTGAGYAHWSQPLYIEGEVETGCVCIGFGQQESNDDGVAEFKDPNDNGVDPIKPKGAPCPEPCSREGSKKVAETTCTLINPTCHHYREKHGQPPLVRVDCHEKMEIKIKNAYPNYNPTVWFDIDNCGTIPMVVATFKITHIGGVKLGEPILLPKCECTPLDLNGDDKPDINMHLRQETGPADQQVDPCGFIQYRLDFHVKQDAPQKKGGADALTFVMEIDTIQWNLAD